jgi:dipeptidase D
MQGGLKENAIPRESVFRFVSDTPAEQLNEIIGKSIREITAELQFSDAGVSITLTPKGNASRSFPKEISDRLINYIFLMPHGLQHRSMAVENLTIASLNLGVISIKDDTVVFEIMARAADDSMRFDICHKLQTLADILQLHCDMPKGYPGWAYTPESEMRGIMKNVLERHGLTYVEQATHGGLECGIVKGLDPKMDIITFGPINLDIHSPDERMDLQSFDDGWTILLDILKDCR